MAKDLLDFLGYSAPRALALGLAVMSYSTIYSGVTHANLGRVGAGYVGKFLSDIAQIGCYFETRKRKNDISNIDEEGR
jgi:hypothetical protein